MQFNAIKYNQKLPSLLQELSSKCNLIQFTRPLVFGFLTARADISQTEQFGWKQVPGSFLSFLSKYLGMVLEWAVITGFQSLLDAGRCLSQTSILWVCHMSSMSEWHRALPSSPTWLHSRFQAQGQVILWAASSLMGLELNDSFPTWFCFFFWLKIYFS